MCAWCRVDGLTPVTIPTYLPNTLSDDIRVNCPGHPFKPHVVMHVCSLLSSSSSSKRAAATLLRTKSVIVFNLVRTSTLSFSEGMKTMYSFRLNSAISSLKILRQCLIAISTTPFMWIILFDHQCHIYLYHSRISQDRNRSQFPPQHPVWLHWCGCNHLSS